MEQVEEWDEAEYFSVGSSGTACRILTIESGEQVAARVGLEGNTYDSTANLWISPVGRWAPRELSETDRDSVQGQDLDLTTLDYSRTCWARSGTPPMPGSKRGFPGWAA